MILTVGLLFNLVNVTFDQSKFLWVVGIVNTVLSLPYLFWVGQRYGIDYVAYIQQAGAVYNGERDYTKLSSHLGPCFYPAGHLLHYLPAFWLHLQTPWAEKIIQFGHIIIHSLTIVYATKIAYLYYGKKN